LRSTFQNDKFSIESNPWGQATGADGYIIALSCLLFGVAHDAPDNVALEISFRSVSTTPTAIADVCWGHPSGFIEAEWRPGIEAIRFDVSAQEDFFAFLPALQVAFEESVRRRMPHESHV
jgi:hypothetical protein